MNTPNILTLSRLVILPGLVGLLFIDEDWAVFSSFILFTVGAVTDFFDGYLARKSNQVSDFGKLMDPIADKIFVATVLIMLIATSRVDVTGIICILIILMREFLVSGLREFLAPKNVSLPVTRLAKIKTTSQMLAIALLILSPLFEVLNVAGLSLLILAAVVTIITGGKYLHSGLQHLDKK